MFIAVFFKLHFYQIVLNSQYILCLKYFTMHSNWKPFPKYSYLKTLSVAFLHKSPFQCISIKKTTFSNAFVLQTIYSLFLQQNPFQFLSIIKPTPMHSYTKMHSFKKNILYAFLQ